MLNRIFNLGNICGAISFLAMICAPGAVEAEMYGTAFALIAICAISAYIAMKEDGQKKR